MASGFLVLPDGRCFSRRWSAHDRVLQQIVAHLGDDPESQQLRQWIMDQLPGPDDVEELGYGAWLRKSDHASIVRFIDLRLMTQVNQRLFCESAKRAASADIREEWLAKSLADLADMVARFENGEPPLSRSDWVDVLPPDKQRIGPGWDSV